MLWKISRFFHRFADKGLAAFQLKEHRRLIVTRTYLERYLAICAEFNEPYFQIKQHSELINNMAPHDDLACYAIQFRKPQTKDESSYVQGLPMSGAQVLTGTNERELIPSSSPSFASTSASTSSEPQRTPPPSATPSSKGKYGTIGNSSFASPTLAPYGTMPPPISLPSPPARIPPRSSGSAVGLAGLASPVASRRPPPRHAPRSESSDDVPRPEPLEDVETNAAEVIEQLPEETIPVIQPIPSPRAPPKYATLDGSKGMDPTPFRLPIAVTSPIVRRIPPREQTTPSSQEAEPAPEISLPPPRKLVPDEKPAIPKLPSLPVGQDLLNEVLLLFLEFMAH